MITNNSLCLGVVELKLTNGTPVFLVLFFISGIFLETLHAFSLFFFSFFYDNNLQLSQIDFFLNNNLNTDINLLAVKFIVMNSAGHQLNIPVDLKSNFLSHQVL
jgi:hypothetical protein